MLYYQGNILLLYPCNHLNHSVNLLEISSTTYNIYNPSPILLIFVFFCCCCFAFWYIQVLVYFFLKPDIYLVNVK